MDVILLLLFIVAFFSLIGECKTERKLYLIMHSVKSRQSFNKSNVYDFSSTAYYLFATDDPLVSCDSLNCLSVCGNHIALLVQYFDTFGRSFVSLFITTTTAK